MGAAGQPPAAFILGAAIERCYSRAGARPTPMRYASWKAPTETLMAATKAVLPKFNLLISGIASLLDEGDARGLGDTHHVETRYDRHRRLDDRGIDLRPCPESSG